jgi:ABC-2 type transport system ATP-binding protein
MRAGLMLADDTLAGVLASTGAPDVEQAFLALVDRAEAESLHLGHDGPAHGHGRHAGDGAGTEKEVSR